MAGCGQMKICRLCPWKFAVDWAMLPEKIRKESKEFMEFLIQKKKKSNKALNPPTWLGVYWVLVLIWF